MPARGNARARPPRGCPATVSQRSESSMPTAPVTADALDLTQLLRVLTAARKGEFSHRMPIDGTGVAGKISDALNDLLDLNQQMCAELARVSTVGGKEGKTSQRAS